VQDWKLKANFSNDPSENNYTWNLNVGCNYTNYMRISETVLERLIIRILPIAVALGSIMYFVTSSKLVDFSKKWAAAILIVWLFDSVLLLSKEIRRVSVVDGKLVIGRDIVDPINDLLSINKRKDERRALTIKTIEFEYLKDGMLTRKQSITKPVFGDLLGRRTRTIEILTKEFPFLHEKIFG
jgi:hypothetical protein